MDNVTIPDEVWRAAMSTYHKTLRKNPGMAWQEAVVAALNAWPDASSGMRHHIIQGRVMPTKCWMLPLPEQMRLTVDDAKFLAAVDCDGDHEIGAGSVACDPECTDCGGTGITYQTERRCACQGPLTQKEQQ